MKKSKFAIYILSVFLIVACFDVVFSLAVEKVMDNRYNAKINHVKASQSDIAVIGASRASHHYIPGMMEDSLGLSAINYGIDGRNIYVHYTVLKSLIENSERKPSVVILDVSNVDVNDVPGFNKDRLNILYPYYKDSVVNEVLADLLDPEEYASIRYSGLVRHNSSLLQYAKDHLKEEHDEKGYIPLSNIWDKEIETTEDVNKPDRDKVRYLQKFIDECKAEGIRLYIVTSPSYSLEGKPLWKEEIKNISKANDVVYLDFENDSLFLSHREWFSDPGHLNDVGARHFTDLIISKLKTVSDSE